MKYFLALSGLLYLFTTQAQNAELINTTQTRTTKPTNPFIVNDNGTLTLNGTWSIKADTDGPWYAVGQTFDHVPAAGAVVAGISTIQITFSETMDPASFSAGVAILDGGSNAIAGAWSHAGAVSTFTPNNAFGIGESVTVNINQTLVGSTGAWRPVDYSWNFTIDNTPIFTSLDNFSLDENTTAIGTVTVDHATGANITYSVSDPAAFQITKSGNDGILSFITAPDFETQTTYSVTVTAADGTFSDSQTISITVNDLNDNAPVLTPIAAQNIDENSTDVVALTGTDLDANTILTFSVEQLGDGTYFEVKDVAGTPTLAFKVAPDHETPLDAVAPFNEYDIKVIVSDGTNTDEQTLKVTVNDLNDNTPVLDPIADQSIGENSTDIIAVSGSDLDQTATLTFSVEQVGDGTYFEVKDVAGTPTLAFKVAPDHETPLDAVAPFNEYDIKVIVSDGTNADEQTLKVTVNDLDDNVPVLDPIGNQSIDENSTDIIAVSASDPDQTATLTFSVEQVGDGTYFEVKDVAGTPTLAFKTAPDHETPLDALAPFNEYDIKVIVSDGTNTDEETLKVTVNDINEVPVFLNNNFNLIVEDGSSVATNLLASDPEIDALFFSVESGADFGAFAINTTSGELSFVTPPDFDNPNDLNNDRTYEVTVGVNDGTNPVVTQSFLFTVNGIIKTPAPHVIAPRNTNIMLEFPAQVDFSTVNSSIIISGSQSGVLTGVWSESGNTITFNPSSDFYPGEELQVLVSSNLNSLNGDFDPSDEVWRFFASTDLTSVLNFQVNDGALAISNGLVGPSTLNRYVTHLGSSDIDYDGDNDIIAFSTGTNGGVTWMANLGNGSFGAENVIVAASGFNEAEGYFFDLNNDGYDDLVCVLNHDVHLYSNDGLGNFTFENSFDFYKWGFEGLAIDIDTTDYNNDGKMDFYVGFLHERSLVLPNDPNFSTLVRYLNNNSFSPTLDDDLVDSGYEVREIKAMDLNGNGQKGLLYIADLNIPGDFRTFTRPWNESGLMFDWFSNNTTDLFG